MTPLREAVILPMMFLTVVLAAAVRPAAEITMQPPSLPSLIAGMLVVALLVRSGSLDPHQLLRSDRTMLANLNGLTVVMTAFVASAQVVTLVVPESGVPALIVWVVVMSLLLQAFAVDPDRVRLLRGLMVTFGAAFTLKFIVLAAVSSPAAGRVARTLQLLFEGITLGSLAQRANHAMEGYLAFGAILLYLIAVAFLPSASWQMVRVHRRELPE
jgi:phage shock protein PspC (stress-responsive transcriptional regulator)